MLIDLHILIDLHYYICLYIYTNIYIKYTIHIQYTGPGANPTPGVVYTVASMPTSLEIMNALENPMTVSYNQESCTNTLAQLQNPNSTDNNNNNTDSDLDEDLLVPAGAASLIGFHCLLNAVCIGVVGVVFF